MNSDYLNNLIEQEIKFSDEIASINNYPSNITHLLYIIIPAFIIKYGTQNRTVIEKCFKEVPISIDDKQDQVHQAYYVSVPHYINNEVVTIKKITLNNYENISLIQLLDNLVHEYNHAVNSIQNEISVGEYITTRTGITKNYFNKNNLSFIRRGEENILEEVINTKQTEKIINIMRDFSNYEINNTVVNNTLFSIVHTIGDSYKSKSYYVESIACQKLMDNKTFISTFEMLRFDGMIDELYNFFDNIVGKDGSLIELSKLLNKSLELQHELSKTKFFKNIKIEKIKEITKKSMEIVDTFYNNTTYK